MQFDPSINLGSLLNAVALIVGFVGAFVRIGGRIDLLAQRLHWVEEILKATSATDGRIARLEEQFTIAQRDINELRHGDGFIQGHRGSIDGQYPK